MPEATTAAPRVLPRIPLQRTGNYVPPANRGSEVDDDDCRVHVGGAAFNALTEAQVVDHVRRALNVGRGGWITTPNIDILQAIKRDSSSADLVRNSTLAVADGMPILWAAKLAGTPLPERVTGSSLIHSLSEGMMKDGRSVYLLGGSAQVPARAADALKNRWLGLRVAGTDSPPWGFESDPDELKRTVAKVLASDPDLVFVGLGFPKQEQLISTMRKALPSTWFVGCGAAIPLAAGVIPRAPLILQKLGLEWLFRLVHEPRRLAERYLRRNLLFALKLLASAMLRRWAHRSHWRRRKDELPSPFRPDSPPETSVQPMARAED